MGDASSRRTGCGSPRSPMVPEDTQRGGYGLQWWTMGGSDAFAAIGLQGQYIYVDPPHAR